MVTTSLHGLVTADSYGIPAVWTTLEPGLGGGDFKFRDYESVITPGRTRRIDFDPRMPLEELLAAAGAAPIETVTSASDALTAALGRLPMCVPTRPFPRGAVDVLRRTRNG